MRSFKYHDYRGVRIVLFLILAAALLLLVYKQFIEAPLDHSEHDFTWCTEKEATCLEDGTRYKLCKEHNEKFGYENIPATGHSPAAVVREKDKAATCTAGGSYDLVTYCKNCDIELDRETVQVDALPHTPGTAFKTNETDPTHTVDGSYDMVTKCVDCGIELDRETYSIPAKGHTYTQWTVEDNGGPLDVILVGKCSCGDEIRKTTEDGVVVKKANENIPCVNNLYVVTYVHNNVTITRTFEDQLKPHALASFEIDGLGTVYVYSDTEALYDDLYGKYYVLGTEGIEVVIDPDNGYTEETVWDENGFAVGLYKCPICNTHVSVSLYSAEHDTRLNSDSTN